MQHFIVVEEMCTYIWAWTRHFFAYSNFNLKEFERINNFFDEYLAEKLETNYPKLIHSSKWKFDYIIARKKFLLSKKN